MKVQKIFPNLLIKFEDETKWKKRKIKFQKSTRWQYWTVRNREDKSALGDG